MKTPYLEQPQVGGHDLLSFILQNGRQRVRLPQKESPGNFTGNWCNINAPLAAFLHLYKRSGLKYHSARDARLWEREKHINVRRKRTLRKQGRGRNTYHADELRQRHLDGDGDLLALVDSRPDQFVVTLRTQQVVDQPLFGVLRPAACGRLVPGGGTTQMQVCLCTRNCHHTNVRTTTTTAASLMPAVHEQ